VAAYTMWKSTSIQDMPAVPKFILSLNLCETSGDLY